MTQSSLVLIGTGSLANSVCDSLALLARVPIDVHVVGRDPGRTAALCYLAGTRAVLAGSPVTMHAAPVGDDPLDEHLGRVLADREPAGVVVCASRQSPWESTVAPSAWTDLLGRAGFGLTLPLHVDIAAVAGRAIVATSPESWLVNACFPDAVNPVLAALDIPVLCGVGNVATMAASVQAALGLPDQHNLHLLAHHSQLHSARDEPSLWLDGSPIRDVTSLLAAQRGTTGEALNRVTGHTAAALLHTLLTGADVDTHVPGPHGLPGGYPVRLHGSQVSVRLPPGVTVAEAIAVNQRAAGGDGVRVVGDEIRFEPVVTTEVPALPGAFPASEVAAVGRELLALRADLRTRPHPSGGR